MPASGSLPPLHHALQRVQRRDSYPGVTKVSDSKRLASEQIPSDARLRLEYFEDNELIDFQPAQDVTGPDRRGRRSLGGN